MHEQRIRELAAQLLRVQSPSVFEIVAIELQMAIADYAKNTKRLPVVQLNCECRRIDKEKKAGPLSADALRLSEELSN